MPQYFDKADADLTMHVLNTPEGDIDDETYDAWQELRGRMTQTGFVCAQQIKDQLKHQMSGQITLSI